VNQPITVKISSALDAYFLLLVNECGMVMRSVDLSVSMSVKL